MAGESGAARGRPSSPDDVRAWIAAEVRVPEQLTDHGARAFAHQAVRRIDDLARELDLKASELRGENLPPELTEQSVVEAVKRLEEKERHRVLRDAAEQAEAERSAVRQRARRRRRLVAALGMIGSAGIGIVTVAGAWAVPVAAASLVCVLASAIISLLGDD